MAALPLPVTPDPHLLRTLHLLSIRKDNQQELAVLAGGNADIEDIATYDTLCLPVVLHEQSAISSTRSTVSG